MQSVSFWLDYINFVKEHNQSVGEHSESGIGKVRNLFERALTATGLHVMDGGMIWAAYREYEQAILQTINDADTQVCNQFGIKHMLSLV